ncbi:cytochrome P450 [Mycena capillaripes]|nr:cytochrome P450 [Mycena capillaripes]
MRLVVCDPRAISHMISLDSWKYCHPPIAQLRELTGPGNLLVAIGEPHTALKSYASVTYVFTAWESELQGSIINEITVDVSEWQPCLCVLFLTICRFDIIGLAAFSTDFRSLDGEKSAVLTAITAVGHAKPSPTAAKILLLSQAYPILLKIPLPRSALVTNLSDSMDAVVGGLTYAAKSGKIGDENRGSALGWALMELSMHPEKQAHLRAELLSFGTTDPTYDDLTEALRLHPIIDDAPRLVHVSTSRIPSTETDSAHTHQALKDDILPLRKPIRTASGALMDKIPIRKGTVLTVPLHYTNVAKSIWGEDAAEFRPERWLNDAQGVPASAKDYPGYHHTMSFLDGPRTCLGKGFALIEMKIVLSLLTRKFVFLPRDRKDTKYDTAMFLGLHPKVAGEPGSRLPMRVKRVE